jgi:hypothetical protein
MGRMRNGILGVVVGVVCLTGCSSASGQTDEDPPVATLQSAAPAPSSPAAADRPVMRPDDGPEEFDRYVEVYDKCLRDEGISQAKGLKAPIPDTAEGKAAVKKCAHLYPETWLDRERRTNPKFLDLLRQTAQCLKGKGHDVYVGGDPVALMYGDNAGANKAYDDEQACERAAFRESLSKYEKKS